MEDTHAQTTVKKAAIVVLISLSHEAEKKTSEELETEIRKALDECLARIPWMVMESIIVVEERNDRRAQYIEKEVKENYAAF